MWTIIKFEKKSLNFLKSDLETNLEQSAKYIYQNYVIKDSLKTNSSQKNLIY